MDPISKLFLKLSELQHDQLELEIMKKENIEIVKKYLTQNNMNVSSKILLTSLLFVSDNNIAMIEGEKDLTQKLKDRSAKVVKKFIEKDICEDIILEYTELFKLWQEKDIKNNNEISKRIEEQVRNTMNKAFWDKTYQDLENKETDSIIVILSDLKEKVKSLCINEDKKLEIDKQFDIQIIDQIIKNDQMFEDDFKVFFQPFMETVMSLQAPANDGALLKARQEIVKQLESDWKLAFVSSLKVLNEAVAEIYKSLISLSENKTDD